MAATALRAGLLGVLLTMGCEKGATEKPEPAAEAPLDEGHKFTGHAEHHGEGHHGHMEHAFENAEEWAARFDDPARDEWQKPEEVIAALELAPDATVADIGAGTGYFAIRLARAVPKGKVLAVDIEPDMIRYLGERATEDGLANVTGIVGKADSAEIGESIDLAFMCNTYHHVPERTQYFSRLAAHMKAGARVVIVDFSPDAPEDAPGPPQEHRIPASVVAEELGAAGFQHVRTDTELLPYQYIAIFSRG